MLLLRVPLQGVGLGTGVTLQTLGAAAGLADDLVGLGAGLGDRLVGGLLSQREDTGGAVATGALTGTAHGTAHRATHRTAHGATHLLLHGRLTTHRALAHTALTHTALAHAALTHGALAHRPLSHRTLAHRAGTLRTALPTGTGGQLRGTARQLGRTTHGATHLLLRRARYAGGYRSAGTSHALLLLFLLRRLSGVLLVLRRGSRGGGQLRAQVLVLPEQTGQFGFDLIEEGIDLVLVIAFSEADGRELLVPHVLGGQRHLFTST
ncbi:conserved hypothetical protein [Streptomyces murinus]